MSPKTLRIGGDVGYMGSDRYYKSRSEQQNFLTNDSSSFVNRNGENINRGHNFSMNFRMRWEIDTLTTLEFMPRFGFNKSHFENNSYSETMGDTVIPNGPIATVSTISVLSRRAMLTDIICRVG